MIINHFKYLKYILKHKYYVLIECFKNGIYWRGIAHDIDKFYPDEWISYVRFTYSGNFHRDKTGYYNPVESPDEGFIKAWFLHQKRNQHHWQYWILPQEEGKIKVLPMPKKVILEMMCDWVGASKANNRGGWEGVKIWYGANKNKMVFHPYSQLIIEELLNEK
jgi:hypothetical protein